jgi:hypothetical protein
MVERAPGIDYEAELRKARRANRKYERAAKSWERLPLRLAALALSVSTLSFGYTSDVEANKQRAAESLPEIVTLIEADDPSISTGVVYLGGFDTVSGDRMAEEIGPALSQILPGDIVSIRKGGSIRDPELLGQQIIAYADEKDFTSISLAGNSMDGITMAEIGDYITHNSNLPVDAIVTNESPSGYDGLKPQSQSDLEMLLSAVTMLKDSEYSTYAKYIVTMIQGIPRFTQSNSFWENANNFAAVSDETWQDIVTGRRSPMWQVTRQAWALKDSDLEATIHHIGELDINTKRPAFIVMRTTNKDDDLVVDVEKSANDICTYAYNAELNCTIVMIDGVHHTSFNFDTEAYTNALANQDDIAHQLSLEDGRYAMASNHYFRGLVRFH